MRNNLISGLAGAAFSFAASGLAFAQAPPPAPAPVYNWTGWYAGINFGGGWGTSNNATTTVTPFDDLAQFFPRATPSGSLAGANSGTASLNQSGPIGGVQIGYNWQFSPLIVFGLEADIQGAAITSDRPGNTGTATQSFAGTSLFTKSVTTTISAEALQASFTNAAISASGFDSVTADLNWLGTVRGRLGYLITPNLLLYATGGLAYGGVSASASDTLNFGNLTADSFALGYGRASGLPPVVATASAISGITPSATATATTLVAVAILPPPLVGCIAFTNSICTAAALTPTTSGAAAATVGTGERVSAVNISGPPTALANASVTGPVTAQSSVSYVQVSKPLSVALATTAQSFARVSDTKVGGTIGGGFEWMMAPNWSFKAEALYYDLGSVTVSTPLTATINPIAAAASAGLAPIQAIGLPAPFSTQASATGAAINKFTGSATVSNAATTHVNFQGVIIRLGLNYHFNLL